MMANEWWRRTKRAIPMALLSPLLLTGLAQAHARIESSVPENGATLADPPAEVRIRYTEPVEERLSTLTLLDAEGRPVPGTEPARGDADARELILKLPRLSGGAYTVESQSLAKDGHVFKETIRFAVSEQQPTPAEAQPAGAETAPAGPAPAPTSAGETPNDEKAPARIGPGEAVLGAAVLLLAGGILLGLLARRKHR